MKYLAILLLLTACSSSAHIVKAPPDGKNIPVTVECTEIKDCAQLLEQVCRHNHYRIDKSCAVEDEDQDSYLVSVTCNP